MITIAQQAWWQQALCSDLSLHCLAIGGGCLILLAIIYLGAARFNRQCRRPLRALLRDESGTAVLEFALVVPIMLFLILVLAQTTLVMTGNLFVHYSAFAATRSAMVMIPAATEEELPNWITPRSGLEKFDSIHTAAAMAVIPVSGRSDTGGGPADAIVEGLIEHYDAYGRQPPRWVQTLIAQRVNYAVNNTRVTIMRTIVRNAQDVELRDKADDDEPFGPREPITVRVEHDLNLAIPVVWPIFADDDALGRYATVRAHYTLTNEGIDDALPPPPTVAPRIDPPDL